MVISTVGAGQNIKHHGVNVTVVNKGSPVYDSDTQVPDYSISSGTAKALIEDPTKTEITHAGGKLTTGSKKFIFAGGVTIDSGDKVTYSGVSYDIVILNSHFGRTIAFGERVQA